MKKITTLLIMLLLAVTITAQDVYVAGTDNSSTSTAKLWKNGFLESTLSSNNSNASAVYVSGENVYTGGSVAFPGEEFKATLWINGKPQYYTHGNYKANINDVFVSGDTIYAVGYHRINNHAVAKLWVNGVEQILTDSNNNSGALSVFVSGKDVYVAGYENNGAKNVAKLWKNGAEQILSDGSHNAGATSVFVDGTNVYVTGYEETTPGNRYVTLWTNGAVQHLTDGTTFGVALDVALLSGFPIVVGGNHDGTNLVPTYWLDGSEIQLSKISNWGQIFSVEVSDENNVYMAGYENNGTSNVAKLWSIIQGTPGIQTQILTTNGTAVSVYVNESLLTTDNLKSPQKSFTLYPNPVNNLLHINSPEPNTLNLYNLQGQVLKIIETQQNTTVSLIDLASGVYFLKDINNGSSVKVIKK